MPLRLDAAAPDFARAFERLVAGKRAAEENVDAAVAAIIADVKLRGDAALLEYTARFDRFATTAARLRLPDARIEQAMKQAPAKAVAALRMAAQRIAEYHKRQLPQNFDYVDAEGIRLGARWAPLDIVGLYVPGGHRGLSEFGADERRAGQGGGRGARRDGGTDAGRQGERSRARRRAHRRR